VDGISRDNFRVLLAAFIEENDLPTCRVAKAIGCSDATINRLLDGITLPSDEMMNQVGIMVAAGFARYATMTEAEKERWTEKASAVAGGVLGLTWISSVVSAAGTVSGLSAAGITSGLAALGLGGGMIVGVAVAAAIPLSVGAAGYGIAKGAKYAVDEWNLRVTELNARWEIMDEAEGPEA
jgi:hypothetical protein